ncbi:MAG: transcriptional repressor [Desulfovibrionaceae bacterium]
MEKIPKSRMTVQRRVILEELRKVTSHPTADEIYSMVRSRLPKISLGTVYRNLDLLAENGEILKLERVGAQMRFDGNTMAHYHVRCLSCGRVGDLDVRFDLPNFRDCKVDGFAITGVSVEFVGLCRSCSG